MLFFSLSQIHAHTFSEITDKAETIAAIVKASELPMSIVIVGVGSADFSAMNQLDADNKMLKDRDGNVAQRDIVQFVPFRDYAKQQISALAAATLAELPRQFCDFMKAKGLKPIGQSWLKNVCDKEHVLGLVCAFQTELKDWKKTTEKNKMATCNDTFFYMLLFM